MSASNRSPSLHVEIRPATLRDLTYTASISRELDKKEILASGPRSMVECGAITWHCLSEIGGEGYIVWINDNPEFAFGITRQSPLTPWLASAWAWGSDKGARYGMLAMSRWAADDLLPMVNRIGADRVEARSIIEHHEAHRWLEWMHFRRETELVDWGRDRTRFVLYAWSRTDFERMGRENVLRGIAASAAAASGFADHQRQRKPRARRR